MTLLELIDALETSTEIRRLGRWNDYNLHHRNGINGTNMFRFTQDYIRLLSAVAGLAVEELTALFGNYYDYFTVKRFTDSSPLASTINEACRYRSHMFIYSCSTHASYQDALANIHGLTQANDNCREISVLNTSELNTGSVNVSMYSMCNNSGTPRLFVICKSRDLTEDMYDAFHAAYCKMMWNEVKSIRQMDILNSLDPSECIEENNDIFADSPYCLTIPEAVTSSVQAIVDERRAEEERKRQEEEARRQAELEEQKAKLYEQSLADLSNIKLVDRTKDRMSDIEDAIQSYRRDITNYSDKIREKLNHIELLQNEYNQYLFVEQTQLNLAEVFAKYIGMDKTIKYVRQTSASTFEMNCLCNITYWLDDEVAQWKNNADAWEYLQYVLSDRYQLCTTAKIRFDVNCCRVLGDKLTLEAKELIGNTENNIPHPHVGKFGCFGNNEYTIRQALEARNYDLAVATVTSCLMQLNLTDGCVINNLVNLLRDMPDRKCFLDTETGQFVSINDIRTN